MQGILYFSRSGNCVNHAGGEIHLPLRQGVVFPGKMRNRADFVAEYSALVLHLSSVS